MIIFYTTFIVMHDNVSGSHGYANHESDYSDSPNHSNHPASASYSLQRALQYRTYVVDAFFHCKYAYD